jgi:hypothetical protein
MEESVETEKVPWKWKEMVRKEKPQARARESERRRSRAEEEEEEGERPVSGGGISYIWLGCPLPRDSFFLHLHKKEALFYFFLFFGYLSQRPPLPHAN